MSKDHIGLLGTKQALTFRCSRKLLINDKKTDNDNLNTLGTLLCPLVNRDPHKYFLMTLLINGSESRNTGPALSRIIKINSRDNILLFISLDSAGVLLEMVLILCHLHIFADSFQTLLTHKHQVVQTFAV
jgi:hypothetical protein